jgi:hypothetical protein
MITSRRMRWAGNVASMREARSTYWVLVGKPEGKRPFGRSRRRWKDNVKMVLEEIRLEDVDWIHQLRGREHRRAVLNTKMSLRVLQKT